MLRGMITNGTSTMYRFRIDKVLTTTEHNRRQLLHGTSDNDCTEHRSTGPARTGPARQVDAETVANRPGLGVWPRPSRVIEEMRVAQRLRAIAGRRSGEGRGQRGVRPRNDQQNPTGQLPAARRPHRYPGGSQSRLPTSGVATGRPSANDSRKAAFTSSTPRACASASCFAEPRVGYGPRRAAPAGRRDEFCRPVARTGTGS